MRSSKRQPASAHRERRRRCHPPGHDGPFSGADAVASVKGGAPNAKAEEDGTNVDGEIDKLTAHAGELSDQETPERPDAETPEGAVSVAGAVGVNIHVNKATAKIDAGSRVNAAGRVALTAAASGGAEARADGSAVAAIEEDAANPEGAGVGAAVALNITTTHALATIETSDREQPGFHARRRSLSSPLGRESSAEALPRGGKDVGVAAARHQYRDQQQRSRAVWGVGGRHQRRCRILRATRPRAQRTPRRPPRVAMSASRGRRRQHCQEPARAEISRRHFARATASTQRGRPDITAVGVYRVDITATGMLAASRLRAATAVT